MSDIVWVLFDLGNVLVEVEQERIFATIAPLISKDVQFVKARLFSEKALLEHFIRNEWSGVRLATEVNRLLGSALEESVIIDAINSELGASIESTVSVIPHLKSKVKVGCLSNTNSIHWEHLQAHYSFMNLFELQFASQVLGSAKPDSEIYRVVQKRLGLPGDAIIFFDDKLENVASARAEGWNAYQYTDHESLERGLLRHGLA